MENREWRTFLPSDAGDWEARDGTLDDGRLAGHSSIVSHRSHMRQPVNIEPSCVMRLCDAIHRRAPVLTAVLHPHGAYVHVRYHIAVHRHVLAYHESASKSILLAYLPSADRDFSLPARKLFDLVRSRGA